MTRRERHIAQLKASRAVHSQDSQRVNSLERFKDRTQARERARRQRQQRGRDRGVA